MSKCEEVRGQLADYAVGGLRDRTRGGIEAHLRECTACRAELGALERTGRLMSAMEKQDAPPGTWEQVRARIESRGPARGRMRLRWAYGLAAGVLALGLVALGIFTVRPTAPSMPTTAVAEVDEEMRASMEGHLSVIWGAPLSDEAAIGLRLAALEGNG
jgi:anti-sigma factor RsiW